MAEFKSGFVAIIGRTNVGKSTLINKLVGEKVAITVNKSQTTRTAIRAIVNRENSQIIFIDTPGVHKPKTKLGETMLETAYEIAEDVVNIGSKQGEIPHGSSSSFPYGFENGSFFGRCGAPDLRHAGSFACARMYEKMRFKSRLRSKQAAYWNLRAIIAYLFVGFQPFPEKDSQPGKD